MRDELNEQLNGLYNSDYTTTAPLAWLGKDGAQPASDLSPDLVIIDREHVRTRLEDLACSTTHEQRHLADMYACPSKQVLVPLGSVFPPMKRKPVTEPEVTAHNPKFSKRDVHVSVESDAVAEEITTSSCAETAQGPASCDDSSASQSSSAPPTNATTARSMQEAPTWRTIRAGLWGCAGLGKTALCMMVAAMHSCGMPIWTCFCLVLLFKLRDPEVQKGSSLAQLLSLLLPSVSVEVCEEYARAVECSQGTGVLFLLDGVDELEAESSAFVHRLLSSGVHSLRKACILATSRPCAKAEKFFSKFDKNLEILGFSDAQVQSFIRQQVGVDLAPQLIQFLDQKPVLASLMAVPLLALFVCYVFKDDPENPPSTRTELYSRLVVLVLRRGVSEERFDGSLPTDDYTALMSEARPTQLEGVPKDLLRDLAEIAWSAHQKKKAIFTKAFIRSETTVKASVINNLAKLGLLNRECSRIRLDLTELFSFQHLTVQEFMAACMVVMMCSSEEALAKTLWQMEMLPHSYVVLQFVAGLLPDTMQTVFFTELNTWLHEHDDCFDDDDDDDNQGVESSSGSSGEDDNVTDDNVSGSGGEESPMPLDEVEGESDDGSDDRDEDFPQLGLVGLGEEERIRVCLNCAKEASVAPNFPAELELTKDVELTHVTAADLITLSAAVEASDCVDNLSLAFVDVRDEESEETKMTRVQKQTTTAMSSVMFASAQCFSLRKIGVGGPGYNVLQEAWRPLLCLSVRMERLNLVGCALDDNDVSQLCTALHHNNVLEYFSLQDNHITAIGVPSVISLKHITTLNWLDLTDNRYGEESCQLIEHELKHVPNLFTARSSP